MRHLIKITTLALMTVMLGSCQIYRKYDVGKEASNPSMEAYLTSVASEPDSTTLPYLGWRQIFTDPLLQNYIEQALASNKNLDNARLNIDIARAQLKGAKLSYLPGVSFNPNGGAASYGGSHMNWSYTLPVAAQWEIDVFAKILNRKRGAKASLEQAEDYEQSVQSQIVCAVASAYYSLVLQQQQLDLSRRTASIWKDQVETMVAMKEAGNTNEAAVVQSRANYYSVLASIPDIELAIKKTSNALAILLGTFPQTFEVTSSLDFNLPDGLLEKGLPVSYLAVRPDVRAAERNLAVAYYATNSARAAFYPGLAITPQGGFTNLLGGMVANPGKWFIQLAGQLTAPLFSRGQNIAGLEAAKAQQKQAMNDFENVVLSASADVSDAMAEIQATGEKRDYLLNQIDQLEKSVEYTNELFTLDRSATYLEVLTAQSSLLQAQLGSLSNWYARTNALITLYQNVGGGR